MGVVNSQAKQSSQSDLLHFVLTASKIFVFDLTNTKHNNINTKANEETFAPSANLEWFSTASFTNIATYRGADFGKATGGSEASTGPSSLSATSSSQEQALTPTERK
ncbi:hypothetical protein WAI453_003197 [Rhynchosporium graminicola]